ncbi:MAG TPA: ABC transporter substrate-binding protein [Usitatibacter sp.]
MSLRVLLLLAVLAFPAAAPAKTFRWSSQGDASTVDPHAENEGFTNAITSLVYETLVGYDKNVELTPLLATSWKNTSPTTWRVNLRRGVRFQDGGPFTADDVVFSFERAKQSGSTFKLFSNQAGAARKIDDYTVEFTTAAPNPILPITLAGILIMSKRWCEKHGATRPQDFNNKEETFSSRNAMGTGPYRLVSYQPGVKTILAKNPDWWGIREGLFEGNVDIVDYRPITNPATRMAALRSGELDFVQDPSVQDVPAMRRDPALKVWEGSEFRVVMIGLDQAHGELVYSRLKGRNPFKDRRVRLALYQAIDIQAMKTQVMRGLAIPTGIALPSPKGAGVPESLEKRYPYDPGASRRLLAEAGYPKGFDFTLFCPNDRYVNDEKICIALASMWAKVGLDVRVETMPKTQYFQRAEKLEMPAFMIGWGGANQDAINTLKPVMHSRNAQGAGDGNYGNFRNAALDAEIDAAESEMDTAKRQAHIDRAVAIVQDEVLVIPLHRQVIPWVSRAGVEVIHRANNALQPFTVKMP